MKKNYAYECGSFMALATMMRDKIQTDYDAAAELIEKHYSGKGV